MREKDHQLPVQSPCCVLDAVVCVHFVGANAHDVLLRVLDAVELSILIPAEVADEVTGKDRKFPGLAQRGKRLLASRYVIRLGHFARLSELAGVYGWLRDYGDGLVPFEKSGLKETHAMWKASHP